MNRPLKIKIKPSSDIPSSLGISEDRILEIENAFSFELNRLHTKKLGLSLTNLAKIVVDMVQPNENELLMIGIKIGEIVTHLALTNPRMAVQHLPN
jgi:hypothetical protein